MPKQTSKKSEKTDEKLGFFAGIKLKLAKKKDRRKLRAATKVKLHKSFKRSYKEDYERKTEIPGLMAHSALTFKIIFKNWKLFVPLIILIVISNIILVGLMSQESYDTFRDAVDETNESLAQGQLGNLGKAGLLLIGTVTTGGLNRGMTEVQQVFMVILLLITWLTTIYLVRHILAGHKVKLRDGLYNALTPLISTFCVLGVIFLELIPLFIVIITYSAALSTGFLETPFYALIFFIFAALLIILSVYLVSSSLLAMIAVTAPGLFPMTAVNTATDLIAGRRIRFILRILYSFFVLAVCWIIIMLPVIFADNILRENIEWLENIPVVSLFLLNMTVFSIIYFAIYLYLFYRQLLDMD